MSGKWAVVRVPAELLKRLDVIALRLERAHVQGLVHLGLSERFGLTTHAVIDRVVRHYESWRRRKAL